MCDASIRKATVSNSVCAICFSSLLVNSYPSSLKAGLPSPSLFLAQHLLRCITKSESGNITLTLKYRGVPVITRTSRIRLACLLASSNISNENENVP